MLNMQRCKSLWRGLVEEIRNRPLYWLTMLLAVMGAFLTTEISAASRGLGFCLWLISNGYLLYHFVLERNPPMIILFIIYEIMNARGILNNW